ncbi:hypothetical protein BDN70DRAFT_937334, partial [Pholiota conissans]
MPTCKFPGCHYEVTVRMCYGFGNYMNVGRYYEACTHPGPPGSNHFQRWRNDIARVAPPFTPPKTLLEGLNAPITPNDVIDSPPLNHPSSYQSRELSPVPLTLPAIPDQALDDVFYERQTQTPPESSIAHNIPHTREGISSQGIPIIACNGPICRKRPALQPG